MAHRGRLIVLISMAVAASAGGTVAVVRTGRSHQPSEFQNGHIAFVSRIGGHARIFTVASDGSDQEPVTPPVVDAEHPAWSPDGSMIAFDSGDIFVINADGSGGRQLTHGDQPYSEPAWSPDGKKIAFAGRVVPFSGAPQIESIGLFVSDTAGTDLTQLPTPGSGCAPQYPSWSPDGQRIAFLQFCPDGTSSIYAVDAAGTRFLSVPGTVGAQTGPSWSPDGKWLVYAITTGIELQSVDGRQHRTLTYAPDSRPSFSPDGRRILFVRERDGVRHLYVMNADGSHPAPLGSSPYSVDSPAWQPIPPGGVPPAPLPAASSSPAVPTCQEPVTGDFDGDGHPDTALVCRTESAFQLVATWEGIASGTAPLPDCKNRCKALAAVDLNGDGSDELILEVEARGSTQWIEVYELPVREDFGRSAVLVAKPGAPDYPPGRPARFPIGISTDHEDVLSCPMDSEHHYLLAHSLDRVPGNARYPWAHSEIDFIFDGQLFTIWSAGGGSEPLPFSYATNPEAFGPPCW